MFVSIRSLLNSSCLSVLAYNHQIVILQLYFEQQPRHVIRITDFLYGGAPGTYLVYESCKDRLEAGRDRVVELCEAVGELV